MSDPASCLRESLRVLRSQGRVVVITPRVLPWADRLYRLLAGVRSRIRAGGRDRVQQALADGSFRPERSPRPSWLPRRLAPYASSSCSDARPTPPRPAERRPGVHSPRNSHHWYSLNGRRPRRSLHHCSSTPFPLGGRHAGRRAASCVSPLAMVVRSAGPDLGGARRFILMRPSNRSPRWHS